MAEINLGAIKFNWRGAYAGGTAYVVDDVVSYQGSSFVCILASTGNLPTDTTYWNVMAEGGDVATVLTTQGDILYRDGSGLQRLGAGTSGQLLQSGGSGANPSWTNAPVGIAMADQWRPPASISGGNQVYTNFERIDTDSPGYIGSAMTFDSSTGIFTFPQTGRYWIQFRATFYMNADTDYVGNYIDATTDNSSYSNSALAYSNTHGGGAYTTGVCSHLFHCANTSTHKVRFGTPASQNGTQQLVGGSVANESEITFIRLGD